MAVIKTVLKWFKKDNNGVIWHLNAPYINY